MKLDNNINLYEVKTLLDGISYPLYNLATWKNGLPFKKINFSDSGIPVIKIAELNNGIGATTAYTNQIFSDDVHLKKGDLLFSWSGNPETSIDIFALFFIYSSFSIYTSTKYAFPNQPHFLSSIFKKLKL